MRILPAVDAREVGATMAMDDDAAGCGTGRGIRGLAPAVAILIALFLAARFLFTTGNDFPYQFHPDERSKIVQIERNSRNFLHPQLMIECVSLAVGRPDGWSRQEIAETGRRVSAAFAAVAVCALAWIGYLEYGLIGLLLAGTSVALCAPLVPYAHYMKEDAALVMGIALVLLAGRWFCGAVDGRHRVSAALLLGAAAGVAASAKYVGFLALLPMAGWILAGGGRRQARPSPWWCLLLALLAAVATVLLINHRVFEAPYAFVKALRFESNHSLSGQKEGGLARPNAYFLDAVWGDTDGLVLALAGSFAVACLACRRERTPWRLTGLAFTLLFLAVLSFSSIPFHRYVLPVIVLMHLWAGLALGALTDWAGRCRPPWSAWAQCALPLLSVAALAAVCGVRTMDFVGQFQDDSRIRLRYWLREHVAPGMPVASEYYSGLMEKDRTRWNLPGPPLVLESLFKLDYDAAVAAGIGYAVLCEPGVDRYLSPHTRPVKGKEGEYVRRRTLLQQIRSRGRLVWRSHDDGRRNMHALTNPLIEVYALEPARSTP